MNPKGRFARQYAALLIALNTFAGNGRKLRRSRLGYMPPGFGFAGGAYAPPPPAAQSISAPLSSGANPNAVPPSGGIGIHPYSSTSGTGAGGRAYPAAQGQLYYFSQLEVIGAFAAIALPQKMYLIDVCVECDDGPGSFQIGYIASNNAQFVAPASATDATGLIGVGTSSFHIPVNWSAPISVPAATFTGNGDCFQATLTFSNQPGANPDISAYRGMFQSETFTDTTADAQTITFDNGPAVPLAFIVMQHALATATSMPMGEIDYTNGGAYKHIIPMQGCVAGFPQLVPAQPLAPANTFLFNQVFSTLGGATNVIAALVVFY